MSNLNLESLPPELQARIAQIVQGNKPQAPVPQQPQQQLSHAPIAKQPSLMDHMIALRQEVAEMRQQINAVGQVTEAVGNATGQLFAMFQEQTQPTNFSTGFQENALNQDDY
jgi:hypothetical protein